jgi:hypothetical protein
MVIALVPRNIDRRHRTIVRAIKAKLETRRTAIGSIGCELGTDKGNENRLDDESISYSDAIQTPPKAAGRTAALRHADAHE